MKEQLSPTRKLIKWLVTFQSSLGLRAQTWNHFVQQITWYSTNVLPNSFVKKIMTGIFV